MQLPLAPPRAVLQTQNQPAHDPAQGHHLPPRSRPPPTARVPRQHLGLGSPSSPALLPPEQEAGPLASGRLRHRGNQEDSGQADSEGGRREKEKNGRGREGPHLEGGGKAATENSAAAVKSGGD